MTVIDVHAHYLAAAVLDVFRSPQAARLGVSIGPGADGRDVLHLGGVPTNQAIPLGLTAEEQRFADMDAAEIDVQVISSWMQLHGYNLPLGQASELARLQNDALADFVRRHPDRLLGAGTLPMQDVGAAISELERIASVHGFRAVQIGSHVNDLELDDPALEPFWDAAAATGTLVLVHPFEPSGAGRLRRHLLELLVGFPAETALAGTSLLLGGVFERHPRLCVSLSHGGGFIPYQLGRLQRGFEVLGARAAAATGPAESLGGLYFDSIMHSADALAFLIAQVGPGRVLLGSDYPFNMGEARPRGFLAGVAGLPDADRAAIEGETVSRLLGGGAAPAPGA